VTAQKRQRVALKEAEVLLLVCKESAFGTERKSRDV
jgi:hypothetical protein